MGTRISPKANNARDRAFKGCAGHSKSFHFSAALGVGRDLKESTFSEHERDTKGLEPPSQSLGLVRKPETGKYIHKYFITTGI